MKYFLLLLVLFVAWKWLVKPRRVRRAPPAPAAKSERMLACARCGVNVPESEGLKVDGQFFCCPAHRPDGARHPS